MIFPSGCARDDLVEEVRETYIRYRRQCLLTARYAPRMDRPHLWERSYHRQVERGGEEIGVSRAAVIVLGWGRVREIADNAWAIHRANPANRDAVALFIPSGAACP